MPVVVTDNGMQARRDYPGHRIVSNANDLLSLPVGTPIITAWYRVGSHVLDIRTAAHIRMADGALIELPEKGER